MKKGSLALFLVVIAASGRAQVISTYGEDDLHPIQNYSSFVQSFAAPGPVLTDFVFHLAGDSTGSSLDVSIFNWSAVGFYGQTVGSALYTTSILRPTTAGDIDLSGLDIAMTQGGEYGVVFDLNGNFNNSLELMEKNPDLNPTGNTFFPVGNQYQTYNYDTEFQATFGSAPEPSPIACLGLALAGLLFLRRKV